jgi:hypothetical protein
MKILIRFQDFRKDEIIGVYNKFTKRGAPRALGAK